MCRKVKAAEARQSCVVAGVCGACLFSFGVYCIIFLQQDRGTDGVSG